MLRAQGPVADVFESRFSPHDERDINLGFVEVLVDLRTRSRREIFIEPHDPRPQYSATRATRRKFRQWDTPILIGIAVFEASNSPDRAVDMNYVVATSPLMEVIHILSNDEYVCSWRFETCQHPVCCVRCGLSDQPPSVVIPFPNKLGILFESGKGSEFLWIHRAPPSTLSAKRWEVAFC